MNQNQLKIREKGQNSLTKFQLNNFKAAETPIKHWYLTSGTFGCTNSFRPILKNDNFSLKATIE